MSWMVNKSTLMFHDLTDEQAWKLLEYAQNIIRHGMIDFDHPAFRAWAAICEFDERQALLLYSTAFPQRAALSVALHFAEKAKKSMVEETAGTVDGGYPRI